MVLIAAVDHPVGRLHVITACLEWESRHDDDRRAQAKALADLALDPALDGPLPVLVAGDLNAPPGSPVLQLLTDVLLDA